ncbi:MAG: sugar kinase [Pseudomonadales bacterium]
MRIAAIGECMLELSPATDNTYRLGFGGDTLNTAIYLARCGSAVDYITALGDDRFSDDMLTEWQQEGVGTHQVMRKAGGLPGLYLIQNDAQGERRFHYWRDLAPAKTVFDDSPKLLEKLSEYDYLYLSGITLSLYREATLARLWSFLDRYRAKGGKVAFDINYRERNWQSSAHALDTLSIMMTKIDIALPSYDDEVALYGLHTPEDCLQRYVKAGANEIVVKDGINGCLLHTGNQTLHIAVPHLITAVDTTAAGDSFNGAYLAARLRGETPEASVSAGQQCAAQVIQHPGAIIPRALFTKGNSSYAG